MTVTLRPRFSCALCGCRMQGVSVRAVRVNKRSLRDTAPGLVFIRCPECDWTLVRPVTESWALDADDVERVAAVRARRWAA